MCCFKTLHHCEDGYVVKCEQCQHVHVGFGTSVLALTHEQFYDFNRSVEEYYEMHSDSEYPDKKMIMIPTIVRSITLVYSLNELGKLSNLLTRATDRLGKEQLFVFYEN